MITVTKAAAEQILRSAEQTQSTGMPLRIAAKVEEDGSIQYGMGFDEQRDEDVACSSEGIDMVVANAYQELLVGLTVDYVELNPGEHQFIFINPNDPNHVAPGRDAPRQ
jgi:iron-sulfur cluster assembly protein